MLTGVIISLMGVLALAETLGDKTLEPNWHSGLKIILGFAVIGSGLGLFKQIVVTQLLQIIFGAILLFMSILSFGDISTAFIEPGWHIYLKLFIGIALIASALAIKKKS